MCWEWRRECWAGVKARKSAFYSVSLLGLHRIKERGLVVLEHEQWCCLTLSLIAYQQWQTALLCFKLLGAIWHHTPALSAIMRSRLRSMSAGYDEGTSAIVESNFILFFFSTFFVPLVLLDTEPPWLQCPDNIVAGTVERRGTAIVSWNVPNATDNSKEEVRYLSKKQSN